MSQATDPAELSYPERPDANGYAKKYFKRRAFYFGTHNSPESFLLFGEWKRRLVETGEAPEVKQVRKEMGHGGLPAPHTALSPNEQPKSVQYAIYASVAASIFLAWGLLDRYFLSSPAVPTVDGVTLTNEEIDFIRGIRRHKSDSATAEYNQGEENAQMLMRILEEGPENAKKFLQESSP